MMNVRAIHREPGIEVSSRADIENKSMTWGLYVRMGARQFRPDTEVS
jgi:hypothetical protein